MSSPAADSRPTDNAGFAAAPDSSCPCACCRVCSAASFWRAIEKAFDAGKLQFFSSLESLRDPHAFAARLAHAKQIRMGGLRQTPFRRTAAGAGLRRPLHASRGHLQQSPAGYRQRPGDVPLEGLSPQQPEQDHDLDADEFIRRFLLHVLPDGFQRIRYYGFLANRYRQKKLARCRQLLGMQTSSQTASIKDYRERYEELTGRSLPLCPLCQQGQMVIVAILPPAICKVPVGLDSS